MPIVVPDDGEKFLLDVLLSAVLASPADWVLHLMKSDSDFTATTVLGDVTEADYTGYSSVVLDREDWSAAETIGERAVSAWGNGPIWFEADSGTQEIFGWYVTDADDTVLLFGSRLPGAPVEVSTTNPIPLTPTMRLSSEFLPS